MTKMTYMLAGGMAVAALGAVAFLPGSPGDAADHLDPPSRTDPSEDSTPDRAADIGDIYVWQNSQNVRLALTFAGPQATTQPATYDPDVLYTIHVSTDGDPTTSEEDIYVRFGEGGQPNTFGVQVTGLPGDIGTISGSVERTLLRSGARVRAGLFDDPFFFDLQGFMDTAATGTLQFDSSRDFFAGQNITAVVIEFPKSALPDSTDGISVWAETARFGGQL